MDRVIEVRRWIKSDYPVNSELENLYLKESANGLDSNYNDFLDNIISKYDKDGRSAQETYEAIKEVVFKEKQKKGQ